MGEVQPHVDIIDEAALHSHTFVTRHAADLPTLTEIQLHHLMAMDGIVELLLMAVGHIHEIVFAQRRYLSQNSCFHVFLFYMLQRYKYLYGVTTPP